MGQPQQTFYFPAAPRQLSLRLEEPSLYHDTFVEEERAYFSLLYADRRDQNGRKRQETYPVNAMPLILEQLDPTVDTWISQAEFFAQCRKIVCFKRVGLCFVDIDTYKIPALARLTPSQLLNLLLKACSDAGIPEPSIVVFSGRGLQAKWLFDGALPRPALPRWSLVQKEMCSRLTSIGADPNSSDASRVLRLVGTVNRKSGEVCRVIHAPLHHYEFDRLADAVLPFTRKELKELRERRQLAAVQGSLALDAQSKPTGHLVLATSTANLKPFIGAQLAWDRLNDIFKLGELRGWSAGAPEGWRDRSVFLGAALLAQAIVHIPKFSGEVRALAKQLAPHWTQARITDATSSVLSRLKDSIAGKKIFYNGMEVDSRYRFKNETLLNWLEITDDEQRQLKTIVSPAESRRRDAERKQEARQATGSVSREAWLASKEEKRAQARQLRNQGMSWHDVAEKLGYANAHSARRACSQNG